MSVSDHPVAPNHGRLSWLAPSELDTSQRVVYESITAGPRGDGPQTFALTNDEGRLEGPFNAFLMAPRLGIAVQEVGVALRDRTGLTDRERELAILEVAQAHESEFEWYAHTRVGRRVGLSDDELEAVRNGDACPSITGNEALLRSVVTELVSTRDLAESSYAEARDRLGHERLEELVVLVGYYELLARSLAQGLASPAPGRGRPGVCEEASLSAWALNDASYRPGYAIIALASAAPGATHSSRPPVSANIAVPSSKFCVPDLLARFAGPLLDACEPIHEALDEPR